MSGGVRRRAGKQFSWELIAARAGQGCCVQAPGSVPATPGAYQRTFHQAPAAHVAALCPCTLPGSDATALEALAARSFVLRLFFQLKPRPRHVSPYILHYSISTQCPHTPQRQRPHPPQKV